MLYMELSEQIKEERRKCNLSQEALANKLHISRQAISKWERGESYPDLEKLIEFSNIFGITLDELVKGDKKLERKLVKEGGGFMRGKSIFGFVLIVLGVLTGLWGGSMYDINFTDITFLSFLIGASLLITLGVAFVKEIPKWIVLGVLYLTSILSCIYLASLKMGLWITLMAMVILIGFVWWLTTKMIDKKNESFGGVK